MAVVPAMVRVDVFSEPTVTLAPLDAKTPSLFELVMSMSLPFTLTLVFSLLA